eukprot:Em0005g815a
MMIPCFQHVRPASNGILLLLSDVRRHCVGCNRDIRSGDYEGHECVPSLTSEEEKQAAELLKRAISTSPDKGVVQLATGGAPMTFMQVTKAKQQTTAACSRTMKMRCSEMQRIRSIVSGGEASVLIQKKFSPSVTKSDNVCWLLQASHHPLRLVQLRAGRLTWHEGFIPASEVWIKIGGDKGGGTFKMSFQIVNIDTPNAVHNTCVFSCSAADDSVTNFHVALDRFKEQIEHMHGMKWRQYTVKVFICGDYEFLSKMYGLSGASDANTSIRSRPCHGKKFFNCISVPIFDIPIVQFFQVQALQRLPLLQVDLENAQHAQEVLQQVATYVALVNGEKKTLAVDLLKQSTEKKKSVKALLASVYTPVCTLNVTAASFTSRISEPCAPNGLTRLSTVDHSAYAGIVEVCLNGTWGTVCADSPNTLWSEKNAQVFCQGLGFSGALNPVDQSTVSSPSEITILRLQCIMKEFGPNELWSHDFIKLPSTYAVNPATPINYKAVRCNGTETSLSQCSHSETTTGCTHASDAAVVCRQSVSDGDVRLVGSPTNGQGAVEIYDQASLKWYRVCPTGWTSSYASVVCQQLGYKTGVSTTYSLNTGMLQKVSAYCTSPKCYVYFAYTTCSSPANSYAGVICTSASSSSGAVRLSGGSRPSVGRVEVLYNGVWGTVCTYGSPWTLTEGQVVCTQLGYKNLPTVSVNPTESLSALSSLYPIWLNGVNCTSQKTKITQCGYTKPIGYGPYCTHYYDAIVDCKSTSGVSPFDGNFMNSPMSGLKRFCRERDGTKKLCSGGGNKILRADMHISVTLREMLGVLQLVESVLFSNSVTKPLGLFKAHYISFVLWCPKESRDQGPSPIRLLPFGSNGNLVIAAAISLD